MFLRDCFADDPFWPVSLVTTVTLKGKVPYVHSRYQLTEESQRADFLVAIKALLLRSYFELVIRGFFHIFF